MALQKVSSFWLYMSSFFNRKLHANGLSFSAFDKFITTFKIVKKRTMKGIAYCLQEYLLYFFAIYFSVMKATALQIMLMIPFLMQMVTIQKKTLFKIQDFTQKLSPLTKLKLFFLIKSHMFLCTIEALNFQISATVIKVLFLFITLICQTALSFLNF